MLTYEPFSASANESSLLMRDEQESRTKKRKEAQNDSETVKQKRQNPAKAISKKKQQDLLKLLRRVDPNNLQAEIRMAVEEQFEDSNLCAFINELFKQLCLGVFHRSTIHHGELSGEGKFTPTFLIRFVKIPFSLHRFLYISCSRP